jgi:sulfatase modifying factor 1
LDETKYDTGRVLKSHTLDIQPHISEEGVNKLVKTFFTCVSVSLLLLTLCCNRQVVGPANSTPSLPTEAAVAPLKNISQTKEVLVSSSQACPSDMVEVEGNYCPATDEKCLWWVSIDGERTDTPEWRKKHPDPRETMTDRCGEFRKPVHCLTTPIKKHFCIDRFEYPNREGERPRDWMSWNQADEIARDNGKRLCTQSEWITAASGNEYHPYPFGDGYHRDKSCNIDNHIHGVDVMNLTDPNEPGSEVVRNILVPSGSKPSCVSPWGVHDLSGNIDEWVVNESGRPYVSGLMGGHVFGVRNKSRAMTPGHYPKFYWYETGFRACKDITP